MCKPASLVVSRRQVWWHPTSDSHEDIIAKYRIHIDGTHGANAVPVEIAPDDGDLSRPLSEWTFRTDHAGYMRDLPDWWDAQREEQRSRAALEDWAAVRLCGWRLQEAFHPHNPFAGPPEPMSRQHVEELMYQWASVWDSVWASVWASAWDSVRASVRASVGASVWDSVRDSVWASVWDSVRDSVGNSVGNSVGASVWAYTGSLFPNITKWRHTDLVSPWDALRELWLSGRVPSFDGTTWRVHVGPDAHVEMEFSIAAVEAALEEHNNEQ